MEANTIPFVNGRLKTQSYQVPNGIYDLLSIANNIISNAKEIIPYAGNNRYNLINSCHSYLRTLEVQSRVVFNNLSRFFSRRAFIATMFHGGNCGEYASLAYVMLRRVIPEGYYAAILCCSSINHIFAAILRNPNKIDNSDVIVDPWPPKAQALLFKDHISHPYKIEIEIAKTKTSQPWKKPNKYLKYIELQPQQREHLEKVRQDERNAFYKRRDAFMNSPKFFSVLTGGKEGKVYRYFR